MLAVCVHVHVSVSSEILGGGHHIAILQARLVNISLVVPLTSLHGVGGFPCASVEAHWGLQLPTGDAPFPLLLYYVHVHLRLINNSNQNNTASSNCG